MLSPASVLLTTASPRAGGKEGPRPPTCMPATRPPPSPPSPQRRPCRCRAPGRRPRLLACRWPEKLESLRLPVVPQPHQSAWTPSYLWPPVSGWRGDGGSGVFPGPSFQEEAHLESSSMSEHALQQALPLPRVHKRLRWTFEGQLQAKQCPQDSKALVSDGKWHTALPSAA